MTRKLTLAVAFAALLMPAIAGALGLGNIQVSSALNEPLQARIPIRGASSEDFGNLRARLGSQEQFDRAGFDRPFILTKLRFKIIETGGSNGYIKVSSKGPVAEPFLNFLLDVTWLSGHVVREYTLLLDPPVYGAAITRATKKQVRTVTNLSAARTPAPAAEQPTAPARTPVTNTQAATPAPAGATAGSYGPVKSGETLWSIATAMRPTTAVSIQAMMLAILKANPEAFTINNVNALRTGSVLRIPSASELRQGRAEALAEVARQHSLWREYRQSIGAPIAEPAAAGQVAATNTSATTPAAKAGTSQGAAASGELKLLAGSAQGSGSGTGGSEELQSLRDELSMAREQSDAAKNENQELKDRLKKVESIVTDLNRLVDLKEEQLAALQAQMAKSQAQTATQPKPVAEPEPKAMPAEPKTAEPKPAMPEPAATAAQKQTRKAAKPKSKRPVITPPPPTSFLDDLNAMLPVPLWTLLAGLGALLVVGGGFSFMRKRRAGAEPDTGAVELAPGESMISQYADTEMPESGPAQDTDDRLDAEAVTEVPDVPAAASLGSDDLTEIGGADGAETAATDTTELPAEKAESTGKMAPAGSAAPEDDPLAEFNVYLAYESFDQAEQLARNAIASAPDRDDYKSKLLEVFYASKNIPAYEAAARELQDAVGEDHEYMVQARDWWSDLGTGRELFGTGDTAGTGTAADDDVFDVTASGESAGGETGLDFDLGSGTEGADAVEDSDSSLDFDLGSLGDTGLVADAAVAEAADGGTGLDFDLGGLDEEPTEAPGVDAAASGLDFDLGGLDDSAGDDAGAAPRAAEEAASGGTGLDFDLGEMDEDAPAEAADTPPPAAEDSSLDFDLGGLDDTSQATAAAPQQDADAGLDFDLGDTTSEAAGPALAEAVTEVNDDLGLDLESAAQDDTAAAEPVADGGDDMDLDFDLSETMTTTDALTASDATQSEPAPAVEDETAAGLDLNLESTGDEPGIETLLADDGEETSLDLSLSMDLEATGGEAGAETLLADDAAETGLDLGLDMDLGSTGGEAGDQAVAEEPDAGLGQGLDMDLGSTGGEAGDQVVAEEPDAGLGQGLDMDLESTGGEAGEQVVAEEPDAGLDLGLDLDQPSTSVEPVVADEEPDADLDMSLDLDLDAAAADAEAEAGSSTDTELPDLSLAGEETGFQDAATEVGDLTDVAQMEDLGIEIPGQGQATSIDTVKLGADAVENLGLGKSTDLDIGLDAGDEESEVGVDTEFKGIFPMDSSEITGAEPAVDFDLGGDLQETGIDAGTSSSVDFDLGADFESEDADSALADAIEDTGDEDDEAPEVDLDVTVFSLPDLPKPQSDVADGEEQVEDEDEDKTLVLGRSATTGSVDDMQTKLDLAQAYMETGDTEGARNLLGEVMAEGDDLQQATAREMLTKLA